MEKIRALVSIHYPLQRNDTALLKQLNPKYDFLDRDFDEVQFIIEHIIISQLHGREFTQKLDNLPLQSLFLQ